MKPPNLIKMLKVSLESHLLFINQLDSLTSRKQMEVTMIVMQELKSLCDKVIPVLEAIIKEDQPN